MRNFGRLNGSYHFYVYYDLIPMVWTILKMKIVECYTSILKFSILTVYKGAVPKIPPHLCFNEVVSS